MFFEKCFVLFRHFVTNALQALIYRALLGDKTEKKFRHYFVTISSLFCHSFKR